MFMRAEVKKKNGVWRGKAGMQRYVALVRPDMHNDTGRLRRNNCVITS
jgi:hypothetical protein